MISKRTALLYCSVTTLLLMLSGCKDANEHIDMFPETQLPPEVEHVEPEVQEHPIKDPVVIDGVPDDIESDVVGDIRYTKDSELCNQSFSFLSSYMASSNNIPSLTMLHDKTGMVFSDTAYNLLFSNSAQIHFSPVILAPVSIKTESDGVKYFGETTAIVDDYEYACAFFVSTTSDGIDGSIEIDVVM